MNTGGITFGFSAAELERFKKQLRNFNSKKTAELKTVTRMAGIDLAHNAKGKVPFKLGDLRRSIRPVFGKTGLSVRVYASMEYAAFVEFGTITKVSIPPELATYAMQFKGKGLRKRGGMAARPYLYPAFKEESEKYIKTITTIMQQTEQ